MGAGSCGAVAGWGLGAQLHVGGCFILVKLLRAGFSQDTLVRATASPRCGGVLHGAKQLGYRDAVTCKLWCWLLRRGALSVGGQARSLVGKGWAHWHG